MANNILSHYRQKYQNFTGSPLGQAALIGAFTLPVAYFLKNPIYRLLRGYAVERAQSPEEAKQAYNDMNQFAQSKWGKLGVPLIAGSLLPLTSLVMNVDPDSRNLGLTTWKPQPAYPDVIVKNAGMFQTAQYKPSVNLSTAVNPQQLTDYIRTNPFMQNDSYAMNLGASILNAAPTTGFTTTLGNVYDSALNKFDKKLNFQGLAGSAAKGAIAGSLAGMFTDVCGAMAGLPSSVMKPISKDIGLLSGIGTALKSILN